jgi:uncharacterized protein
MGGKFYLMKSITLAEPNDEEEGCDRLGAMAIHPDLLDILACPVCKTPVEVIKEGAGLRCGQCRRVYPVRDDIPIMLPEEATVEE